MYYPIVSYTTALCTSSAVTPIVIGTSADDAYLNNSADQEGQTYQQNPNSGGAWIGHIIADDGTSGNRLDGNGRLRCFDLIDIFTGSAISRYRNNSNVFAGGIQVADGIKGLDADGSAYVQFGTRIFKMAPSYTIPVPYFDPVAADSGNGLAFDSNGDMWGFNTTSNKPVRLTNINYTAHTCTETDAGVAANTFGKWGRNVGGIAGRIYYIKTNTIRYIDITNIAGGATDVITDAITNLMFVIGDDGYIYYARAAAAGATVIVKADSNGSVIATCSVTNGTQQVPQLYTDGFIWSAGETSVDNYFKINASTMTITSTLSNSADWFHVVGPYTPGTVVVNGVGSGVTAQGGLGFIDCV